MNVEQTSSLVTRHSPLLGWLLVAIGAVTDAIYHAPTILFGLQWPPAVDAIGEFGHTVIFVGIVIIIFAMLRKHSR